MNKNSMKKVVLSLVGFICLAMLIQMLILQNNNSRQVKRTSKILLNQVESILSDNENSEADLLESLKEEYIRRTRAVTLIIEQDETIIDSIDRMKSIAGMMDIDEIHIFDESGYMYTGTVPEYYGLTFDRGEQVAFFKPMLTDKSLAMCQDVTPNTMEGKNMMYAIAWDSTGTYMVQLGIEPVRLLKEFENNQISNVIGKMPAYDGTGILVANADTGEILGSSDKSQVAKTVYDIGIVSEGTNLKIIERNSVTLGGFKHICYYRHHGNYLIAVDHSTEANLESFLLSMFIQFVYLLIASVAIAVIFSRLFKANDDINEQLSILTSMSEIYYSMHLIDLREDSFKEYLASGMVKDIVGRQINATQTMKNTTIETTQDEYIEEMLAFTDLKTLPDRMANKKIISHEFKGKHIGWVVASFISIEKDKDGKPTKVVYASRNINDERMKEEQLIAESNTDEMTGLCNRRMYEDDMMSYPDVPPELDFVYASIDINGLKVVNDTMGHSAGDELIRGAANVLKRTIGNYGRVYRTGGDEFVAMFFADESHLKSVMEETRAAADEWCGKNVEELSLSIGYATKREFMTQTVREMAEAADQRMYADKELHYARKGVDRRGQAAAHKALCNLYTKILKVNLTEDSHTVVSMNSSEQTAEKEFAAKISEWLSGFGKSGQVHPDDLDEYLEKTDIDYLRNYFKSGETSLNIHYRRKYGDDFKQCTMEMIPADDYAHDNQTLFLYVKDVDK